MLSKKIALGLSASMFLILAACNGKGGFAGTTTSSSLGGNGATSVLPPIAEPDAFQKLQYKGYVAGGSDSGTLTIDIDKANGALLLIMPLQINAFIENLEAQIPDLPGVKLITYKDDKGASFIAVSVPLRYVLKGASFLNPARLPNGDALPQIAGGELPSLAIKLPGKNNVNFHIYIGLDTVCLYVSSPFDPYFNLTFPIKNGQTTIGFLSSVKAQANFDGGFFLSAHMPDEVARIIDDHFHF